MLKTIGWGTDLIIGGATSGVPHPDEAFVQDSLANPEKEEPETRSRASAADLSRAPYLFPTDADELEHTDGTNPC
ncbi:hypothetical protein BHM03_00008336 [Ensete ventricosum]|nr:hypothetical protein BHM03_00008336 [Ensete ventricosum]